MKKWLAKISVCLVALCTFAFGVMAAGCGGKTPKAAQGKVLYADENTVVMTVLSAEEGATLKDVMTVLKEEGELTFVDDGTGMIVSVNERGVSGNEFWGIYTSAKDYSNTAWGTTEYDGETLGSAMFGYVALPALEGEFYVLELTTW